MSAVIVSMNAMIGSGIFAAPAALASAAGPAGIITYLLVIVGVCAIGLSLARIASYVNSPGSFYAYTYPWGGNVGGLIASGSYIFGLIIAMGLLAKIAGIYIATFLPFCTAQHWGMFTIMGMTLLTMCGMGVSTIGQYILIAATIFPLLAIAFLCFMHTNFSLLFPFAPFGIAPVIKSARIIIFSFFGFECCASLFTVVQNPNKNIPRALILSILLVGILYFLLIFSLFVAIPLPYFSDPFVPLSTILAQVFPAHTEITYLIHLGILSAILGTIHAMLWGTTEFLQVIVGKIALMKPVLPFFVRPVATTLIGVSLFVPLIFINNLNLFFSFVALGIVGAYLLSIITLFFIKSEWQSGRNIITVIAVGTILLIIWFAGENIIEELCKERI